MSNDDYQHRNTFCTDMKKEVIKFPEIPGIKWVSKVVPDIIEIPIELYQRAEIDMGIEAPSTTDSVMFLDLSKLTIVRYYFPKDTDTHSDKECVIEALGSESSTVVSVGLPSMMKAWLFYKKFKRDDT